MRLLAMTAALQLAVSAFVFAQSTTATLSGRVLDPTQAAVSGASVTAINVSTNVVSRTATNEEGFYTIVSLPPGPYRVEVTKPGFKALIKPDVFLHVQDVIAINFKLSLGAVSESITVEGGAPLVDAESAAVSTVVDRHFAENLPMNGRSFQTLIELTPGVVLTSSNNLDSGQFSVNGQRAASNYWMIDGVSANIGIGVNASALPGNGLGGTLGSFSAQGGTNSLVSIDAMQEFRIQTSSFAPEFGRTPGGQISIVTRSGTNQFHGTVFDYLRNSVLDASDWFADQQGLPKPEERQNDFGGVLGGPVVKDRTFFFFSYEGQRLRLPQVALTDVPDLNARQSAVPALQPYLNAFPLPSPNLPDITTGVGQFNASYSNKSSLDAYSLRIDHSLKKTVSLFGRYNYSPSEILQRGQSSTTLNTLLNTRITTQTATAGANWLLSPSVALDLHLNYSRVNADGHYYLDNFGGAVPLTSLPFPSPFTSQDGFFLFTVNTAILGSLLDVGPLNRNVQRQVNIVGSLVLQEGPHALKFGVDLRRLTPVFQPYAYLQQVQFGDMPSAEKGDLSSSIVVGTSASPTFLFRNLGVYAQDTWRIAPRLTATYGLRWDVDFVPRSLNGPSFPAVTGFNLNDLSGLALAPPRTPPYGTRYGNVAPRFGIAYQLRQSKEWQSILRGGFGAFYDLASTEAGNSINLGFYPFGNQAFGGPGTFPLSSSSPPPIVAPSTTNPGGLYAFDPKLRLPYTLQWNVAVDQALGQQQKLSVSYIGAAGRRLIQTAYVLPPNPAVTSAQLVSNTARSDYTAAQVQFQRRLARGLQALASYTWSHSIDTASAGSAFGSFSNILSFSLERQNRGPSDFDVRNTFTLGVTYDIPVRANSVARAFLGNWSLESFVLARSSPPLTVFDQAFSTFNSALAAIRPDLVPGQPLYIYGTQCASVLEPLEPNGQKHLACPAGKGLNPAAFTDPPLDVNGNALRQGTLGRNAVRAFGATQWDFAVHRDFPIREALTLQFRAEIFNCLNHPNFGPPNNSFLSPQFGGPIPGFGVANEMFGQSLNSSNQGGGGFSALYQIGGPRSIQLAMKLSF